MARRDEAVFLLRNSDPSQDLSLESQREECERFATERGLKVARSIHGIPADLFIDGAFIDESISGAATEKRRGFQALLQTCQDPNSRIRYVVCYDVYRFGRFDPDEAGYYRHTLKQCAVEVLYVAEGFRGDDADDLVRGVKQWQGYKYLKDLSKVTQRGLIRLAQQGYWLGGVPPFAYDLLYEDAQGNQLFIVRFQQDGSKTVLNLDGSVQRHVPRGERLLHSSWDRARLCPSENRRVALVLEIFEMYVAGAGYKAVAKVLNKRGVSAPRDGRWSKRHKRGWSPGTVKNIIENPAYLGRLVYNRTSFSRFHQIRHADDGPRSVEGPPVRANKVAKLPKEDWIVSDTGHPALIMPDLWHRAQAQRADRRKPHALGSRSGYTFSGLVDCAACDHHYQGHTTTKGKRRNDGSPVRTRSYLCGGYDAKGAKVCPTRWSVGEGTLWQSTMEAIAVHYEWLFASAQLAEAVRRRAREIMSRPTATGPDSAELLRRVEEIDRQVGALVSNLSPANLSMLDAKLTELRHEKEELESRIAQQTVSATNAQQLGQAVLDRVGEVVEAAKTIQDASPSLKRRFVRELVERIQLDPRTKTGTAWLWRLPKSVLDSLRMSVSSIAGAGLEPATSGL